MPEPRLSADDIDSHLGVTKATVCVWSAEKGMPAHKIGRLWKFQATEVDDWVRRGGAAAPEEPRPSGLPAEQAATGINVGGHSYLDLLPIFGRRPNATRHR